jgi:hypothetical protein
VASVKDEFIALSVNKVDLDRVLKSYSCYGFVGCLGSIDCIHIGWDRCPSEWRPVFIGKAEGYPSSVYQVIDNRHKIQAVPQGHPGARNDKTIVRLDKAVAVLKPKNRWLGAMPWIVTIASGMKKFFRYNLICNGGCLRWPCLVTGIKDDINHAMRKIAQKLGSIWKDIECTFGGMKKRFKWLKNWNVLSKQANIDNVFTTCCILHDIILLEQHEYLAKSFVPSRSESLAKIVIPGDHGGGLQVCVRQGAMPPVVYVEEVELDGGWAAEWKMCILTISKHIEHKERAHLPSLSDSG